MSMCRSQRVLLEGALGVVDADRRYYAAKPPDGPDWGLRFTATLVFR